MTRMAVAIDLDACVGCHAYVTACKQDNNMGIGPSDLP